MGQIRSIWLALFALTAGWLYLVPFYEEPRYVTGAALIALGVAGTFQAVRRAGARAGVGALLATLIVAAQALVLVPYVAFAVRSHETGVAGRLGALVLRLLGERATVTPEGLLVDTGVQTLVYSFTWEALGLLPLVLFVAGAVPVLLLSRVRWTAVPAFALFVILFAEARFALLVSMTALSGRLDAFWSRPVTVLTLVPLAILVPAAVRISPDRLSSERFRWPAVSPRNPRLVAASLAALLAAVALVGALGFEEPGVPVGGRVIVEEGLSDWAWTTEEFDTEWYGEKSGYNYYNLYQYLGHYYEMERNTGPVTAEMLSTCDVYIVKVPTSAFAAEEIDAIEQFVRDGGGLFLIGDHTNVFGTSTNINPLAERFGLRFNHDATYGLASGELSEYRAPALLPHPIVQHLPGPFLFGTAASMDVAPGARAVMVDHGLKALNADYSQDNFFSEVNISPEMRFGSFASGAAVRYGRGRVAAFSDSTVFSNFWMHVPGKPELLLGYLDWLNRENGVQHASVILAALAAGLFAAAILVGRGHLPRSSIGSAVAAGLVVGAAVAVPLWAWANRAGHPPPQPVREYTSVCFEREYSRFALPDTLSGFMAGPEENLHTFYVWVQRVGYVPTVGRTLADALDRGDVVVIVDPQGEPSAQDVDALLEYVAAGGSVLIAESGRQADSSAAVFAEAFGMTFGSPATGSLYGDADGGAFGLELSESAQQVSGGTPLLTTDSGDVVGAYARHGAGTVVVFGDAGLFFNSSLGPTNLVPGLQQRRTAELEFGLVRFLAEGGELAF